MGEFTKNTLITFITRVLQLLLGITSSIIIARVLGPTGKGIYSLAILLPGILITITNLGIGQSSVYYTGKRKYSPQEIFGNNIIFSFFFSVFTVLIASIIILFLNDLLFPGVATKYLFLAVSLIPLQIFLNFIVNILLGLQKIKRYNLVNLFQGLAFLLLIALFLFGLHYGVGATILAEFFSSLIASFVLFLWTKKEAGGIHLKFNKSYFKDSFSYGIKSYLGNICHLLHFRIDIFLINAFLSPAAVGFYSVATGLTEQIWLISQSASTILFSKVSSETSDGRLKNFTPLVCRNMLFITGLIAIVLLGIGHWIIP